MGKLFNALKQGDFTAAKNCLKQGESIDIETYTVSIRLDYVDSRNETRSLYLLPEAIASNRYDVFEFLLENRANPFLCSTKIMSALKGLKTEDQVKYLSLLMKHIDFNAFNDKLREVSFEKKNFFHEIAARSKVNYDPERAPTFSLEEHKTHLFFDFSVEDLKNIFKDVEINIKAFHEYDTGKRLPKDCAKDNSHSALMDWISKEGLRLMIAPNHRGLFSGKRKSSFTNEEEKPIEKTMRAANK